MKIKSPGEVMVSDKMISNNKNSIVANDNTKVFFKVSKVEDTIEGTIKKITKGFFMHHQLKTIKSLTEKDHKIKNMLNLKWLTLFFKP